MYDKKFGRDLSKPCSWAERIFAAYRRSVEAIFETGRLLIEAKGQLAHGEFTAMVQNELPFGIRTAQMLMKIAGDERFSNAKYIAHLPPTISVLYELTTLSDDRFNAFLDSESFESFWGMKRQDIRTPKMGVVMPPRPTPEVVVKGLQGRQEASQNAQRAFPASRPLRVKASEPEATPCREEEEEEASSFRNSLLAHQPQPEGVPKWVFHLVGTLSKNAEKALTLSKETQELMSKHQLKFSEEQISELTDQFLGAMKGWQEAYLAISGLSLFRLRGLTQSSWPRQPYPATLKAALSPSAKS